MKLTKKENELLKLINKDFKYVVKYDSDGDLYFYTDLDQYGCLEEFNAQRIVMYLFDVEFKNLEDHKKYLIKDLIERKN